MLNTSFYYFLLIWATGFLLLALITFILGYEQSFLYLNSFRLPFGEPLIPLISWMGNGGVAGFICWLVFRKERPDILIFCLLSLIISGIISQVFKQVWFADWHRPLFIFEGKETVYFFDQQAYRFNSFPSGHATTAGALAFVFMLGKNWRRLPAIGIALFALSIGYSRIYIGVHFPGDVLAGWFLGMFVTTLLYIILKPRKDKKSGIRVRGLRYLSPALGIFVTGLLLYECMSFPVYIWKF